MKKQINKYLIKKIQQTGCVIEKKTPKENVVSLIQKLQPYSFEKELIRLGPKGDGGYLVPDDLKGIEACFSPGVDQISGFEEDCSNLGMKLFLADKSVNEPNLKLASNKFNFIKKYVGCTVNEDFITMDNWVSFSNVSLQSDLLLQMDIEGYEYITLINMSDSLLKQFRIIVIEFHTLDKLWNKEFYFFALNSFNKILQNHTCIHIHPNNCLGIDEQNGVEIPIVAEFTFIRNDRISKKTPQIAFPHPLDFDNTSNDHISLPKNWYNANTIGT